MSLFQTIKAAVTTRQAAEHFGLAVDKHGMFNTFKRRIVGAFFMTITKQEDIAYD